jgi:hypothetical protein
MNPKGKGKDPGSPADWISHAKSDLRLALERTELKSSEGV